MNEATNHGSPVTSFLDDYYCIEICRYGALGLEEEAGRLKLHGVDRTKVAAWLDETLNTLCPGDRAEITITRGRQSEQAASAREAAHRKLRPPVAS